MGLRGVYFFEQSIGAWIGIGIVSLWAGRSHFWSVSKKIFINKDKQDDSDEPISFRAAGIGIIGGLAFLTILCLKAGMSLLIIGLFWGMLQWRWVSHAYAPNWARRFIQ